MVEHKIVKGNCIEKLKDIDEDSVDLIITSPPYNIGIEYDSWNDRMIGMIIGYLQKIG